LNKNTGTIAATVNIPLTKKNRGAPTSIVKVATSIPIIEVAFSIAE
jgi:hypothetical protein